MQLRLVAFLLILCIAATAISQHLFEQVWDVSGSARPDFSPDGTLLAIGGSGMSGENVDLYTIPGAIKIATFPGKVASFSASGNRLLILREQHALVIDVPSLTTVREFETNHPISGGRLSNDGDVIYLSTRKLAQFSTLHLLSAYEVETSHLYWSQEVGRDGTHFVLTISPDGSKVATGVSGNQNYLRIMDAATGGNVSSILIGQFRSVEFLPDSVNVVVGTLNQTYLWDTLTAFSVQVLSQNNVSASACSPLFHSATLAESTFGTATFWFWDSTIPWVKFGEFLAGNATYPDFSPDGDYFAYSVGSRTYVVRNPMSTEILLAENLQLIRGVVTGGNLAALTNSDDEALRVLPGIVFVSTQSPVEVVLESTASHSEIDSLRFMVESFVTSGTIMQRIELYDFAGGRYVEVDARNGGGIAVVEGVGPASNYVQPGTNRVRARLTYKAGGPAFTYPWRTEIDYVSWRID